MQLSCNQWTEVAKGGGIHWLHAVMSRSDIFARILHLNIADFGIFIQMFIHRNRDITGKGRQRWKLHYANKLV